LIRVFMLLTKNSRRVMGAYRANNVCTRGLETVHLLLEPKMDGMSSMPVRTLLIRVFMLWMKNYRQFDDPS
jgi:hypothetical protein